MMSPSYFERVSFYGSIVSVIYQTMLQAMSSRTSEELARAPKRTLPTILWQHNRETVHVLRRCEYWHILTGQLGQAEWLSPFVASGVLALCIYHWHLFSFRLLWTTAAISKTVNGHYLNFFTELHLLLKSVQPNELVVAATWSSTFGSAPKTNSYMARVTLLVFSQVQCCVAFVIITPSFSCIFSNNFNKLLLRGSAS